MSAALAPFLFAGRHSRTILIASLATGIALPELAQLARPWLAEGVAAALFFAALRVPPRAAIGDPCALPRTLALVGVLQVALPVASLLALAAFGWLDTLAALALAVMLAAPPIAGSPNLTVLVGQDPAPALRLLVLGTLLMPLTVLPTLWLVPALGTPGAVLAAAARLLALIGFTVAAALLVRGWLMPRPTLRTLSALDGAGVLFLCVVILGLMSALGPALRADPWTVAGWLAVATGLNVGLQLAVARLHPEGPGGAAGQAIAAGNRNIALFLVSLPAGVIDPLLLFIGCYQIPMYLTPVLLRRFYGGQSAAR